MLEPRPPAAGGTARLGALWWLPVLAALCLLPSCPSSRPAPASPTLDAYRDALRALETEREETRSLRRELRDREREMGALRKELDAARVAAQETPGGVARVRGLEERVRQLELELQAALETVPGPDSDPGPGDLARVFLTAVQRRDRDALETLVDWEGLLEVALQAAAETPEEGRRSVEEFRTLPEDDRRSQGERARQEFLDLVLGNRGPRLAGSAFFGQPQHGVLRYRSPDESAGVSWDVLVRKGGGGWRIVGLVRNEPRVLVPEGSEGSEDQDSR